MKTKHIGAMLGLVLGLGSTQASAVLIEEWDFDVTAVWLSANFGGGGGTQVQNDDELSWGAAGGDFTDSTASPGTSRSALVISDEPASGNIFTNLGPENTVTITHYNNTLSSSFATLNSAVLRTSLTLTPADPPGPALPTFPPLDVNIVFNETGNRPAGVNSVPADCAFPSNTTCDDIFVVPFEDTTFSFVVDNYKYTTTIGATGLGPLDPLTCAAANEEPGCFGLTTDEAATSPVQFNFSIIGEEIAIPVPATLALMGVGLLGLGVATRRRRAS